MAQLFGSTEHGAPPSQERKLIQAQHFRLDNVQTGACRHRRRWSHFGGGERWGQSEWVPRGVCEWDVEGEIRAAFKDWSVGSEGGQLMRKCLVCNPKKVMLYPEGNGKSSEELL